MKKRIYRSVLLLLTVSMFAVAVLCSIIFYQQLNTQMKSEVRNQAQLYEKNLVKFEDDVAYFHALELSKAENRITVIDSTGKVLFDSYLNAEELGNHLKRPEVQAAIKNGSGSNTRYSNTLKEETYYYALLLPDGRILRLAKTTHSILGIFLQALPIVGVSVVVVFILSNWMTARLTKRIVAPINAMNAEVYDELSPFLRRIHEQDRQIHEQIRDLEQRATTIRAITEGMQEGLLLLNRNGQILSANQSAISLLEGKDDSYVGKNILALTREPQMVQAVKAVLAGTSENFTANYHNRIVQVFLSPVAKDGAIILFLDVTEKTNAEKMRREFSANVSHELKTPLTTISGYAEMLETGMVQSADVKLFAGKLKAEATRLIHLVEDIIRLSEFDEQSSEKHLETNVLADLVAEIVARFDQAASEKQVHISISGERFDINANQRMLDELLQNLLENAVKYNRENGEVTVSFSKNHQETTIQVADTGIGIPKEHLERVFERFYRVDSSRSKKTGGTGLGLSIVKHVAQYHDGYAEIDSTLGVGTTVTVVLR